MYVVEGSRVLGLGSSTYASCRRDASNLPEVLMIQHLAAGSVCMACTWLLDLRVAGHPPVPVLMGRRLLEYEVSG